MTGDDKSHWRTIFLSDLHLGSRLANANALNEFLKRNTADHIVLVGDIIDFWALNGRVYFPMEHMNALRKIIKLAANGVKVTYIPGNHDEVLRDITPSVIGSIELRDELVFTTAAGKRYLVQHGDIYDGCCKYAKWLVYLGDFGYTVLLRSNVFVNYVRRKCGFGNYWSLSAFVKSKVKQAVNFIGHYERLVASTAKSLGVDGVICGHIHTCEMRDIDGVHYINTGDFCESLSAVVETFDGELRLLRHEDWYVLV